MKCKHEWRWLYKFKKESRPEGVTEGQGHLYTPDYINFDVFYCIHCLKQTSKERECPKEMKN